MRFTAAKDVEISFTHPDKGRSQSIDFSSGSFKTTDPFVISFLERHPSVEKAPTTSTTDRGRANKSRAASPGAAEKE